MMVKSQINAGYSWSVLLGAALSAAGCFWLLSHPTQMRLDAVGYLKSDHLVKVRHASQIAWTGVLETKVFDGSLIEVPADAAATLTLDHGHPIELEPGSIVRVTQTETGAVRNEVLLKRDVRSGRIAYRRTTDVGAGLDLSLSEIHLLTPFSGVDKDLRKQQMLSHQMNKSLGNVLSFDYVLGNTRFPNLRLFGAFDDFSVKPAYPPVGALYKAAQEENPCIGFVWSPIPVPGVNYVVQISKTHDFSFFRSFGAEKNFTRIKVADSSDYFWRVRAVLGDQSLMGDTARFTVYKAPLPPEVVRQQQVVRRIRDPNASLMDLELCSQ